MNLFFQSNPGLRSRFNTFIEFDDYNPDELLRIFENICVKNDYKISEGLKIAVRDYFVFETTKKDARFANGRLARNIYDDLVMNQARRVSKIQNPTDDDLVNLIDEDFASK